MTNCVFCKVFRDQPERVILEDNDVAAFDDISPKAPVHILVIPKEHIQSVAHLKEDNNDIITKLIYAAKRIAAEKDLAGYKLVFNVGRAGGQVIDHLHLHLLGGWEKPEDREKGFCV